MVLATWVKMPNLCKCRTLMTRALLSLYCRLALLRSATRLLTLIRRPIKLGNLSCTRRLAVNLLLLWMVRLMYLNTRRTFSSLLSTSRRVIVQFVVFAREVAWHT